MVYREEFFGDFRIIEYEPYRLDKPGFGVVALPDTGLVGVIGAGHLVKALKLKEIGGIDSYTHLPPIAIVSRKNIRTPIRIFAGENIIAVYSEFMPSPSSVPFLARVILDFLERKGIKYVLMASGLPVQNRFELETLKTYYISTSREAETKLKDAGAIPFENGYLVGPYAIFLKEAIRSKMDSIMLMTEAFFEFPDPEASARNLEIVSKLIGKEVDVKELIEQAEIIRIRARDAMKAAIPNLTKMRKEYEYSTPLNI